MLNSISPSNIIEKCYGHKDTNKIVSARLSIMHEWVKVIKKTCLQKLM